LLFSKGAENSLASIKNENKIVYTNNFFQSCVVLYE